MHYYLCMATAIMQYKIIIYVRHSTGSGVYSCSNRDPEKSFVEQ